MDSHGPERAATGNRLLDRLSDEDYSRILPHLRRVPLPLDRVLYDEWEPIASAYFPTSGIISAMVVTFSGNAIEVANIGREGVSGVTAAFGLQPSVHKVIVQVAGEGFRIDIAELRRLAEPGGTLHVLLLRYFTAFFSQVSQSVACNGLHNIKQRCCRWLLMTHDRIDGDVLTLTHEFLAIMLGVRRASVSDTLKILQEEGLLRCERGNIIILDRHGLEATCCECHGKVEEDYARLLGH